MRYIDYEKDLKSTKVPEITNELSDNDFGVLEDIETEAIALVDSYLGGYYDTDMIFSGEYSYPYIKKIVKDFMLLYLYERIENQPPDYTIEKTDKHLKWLEKVAKRQIAVNLPAKELDSEQSTTFDGDAGYKFI